jgi:hypothetical protein
VPIRIHDIRHIRCISDPTSDPIPDLVPYGPRSEGQFWTPESPIIGIGSSCPGVIGGLPLFVRWPFMRRGPKRGVTFWARRAKCDPVFTPPFRPPIRPPISRDAPNHFRRSAFSVRHLLSLQLLIPRYRVHSMYPYVVPYALHVLLLLGLPSWYAVCVVQCK